MHKSRVESIEDKSQSYKKSIDDAKDDTAKTSVGENQILGMAMMDLI